MLARWGFARGVAVLLAAVSLAGCARDHARRDEGARVVRAIDQLIAANEREKAQPLAALEATPCSEGPACAAKEACTSAFRPLVLAFTLRDQVRASMKAPGAAASIDALQATVEAADAAQKDASTRMDACLGAAREARRIDAP